MLIDNFRKLISNSFGGQNGPSKRNVALRLGRRCGKLFSRRPHYETHAVDCFQAGQLPGGPVRGRSLNRTMRPISMRTILIPAISPQRLRAFDDHLVDAFRRGSAKTVSAMGTKRRRCRLIPVIQSEQSTYRINIY